LSYAKANFSAEQPAAGEDPRVQSPDGDEERPPRAQKAAREGAQETDAGPLLRRVGRVPRNAKLRKAPEFRAVYESGRRYDGALMTAFVAPNALGGQRLGITVSRKVSRKAVGRNRIKRLLRETFRLSEGLRDLRGSYDWVLNGRRRMLEVKLADSSEDFRKILARVARDEGVVGRVDER
jgi:ribonuclease P protein component